MNDRQAFLAAIRANRDDDAPRLQYADWLDEHGEGERAEFIRVQIANERTKGRTDKIGRPIGLRDRHAKHLCERDAELKFGKIGERILSELPGGPWTPTWNKKGEYHASFSRGFVSSLTMTAYDCLKHFDSIIQEHPIESVNISVLTELGMAGVTDTSFRDAILERWPNVKFTFPLIAHRLVRQINVPQELIDDANARGGWRSLPGTSIDSWR